jgi:hypothetical protein
MTKAHQSSATQPSPLWRPFFILAALYNLVIGGAGLANASAPVNDRIVGLLVACFGIVYALVGRDAARFGPVLWAGIVGKLGIVALLLPDVLAGRAAAGTGVILAGDALFTFGFLVFLLGRRKTPS